MEQLMSTNKTIRLGGTIVSPDPIYSPGGYARSIFGGYTNMVSYKSKGNMLAFKMNVTIAEDSIPEWQQRLLNDGDGNVTWFVTDEAGVSTPL